MLANAPALCRRSTRWLAKLLSSLPCEGGHRIFGACVCTSALSRFRPAVHKLSFWAILLVDFRKQSNFTTRAPQLLRLVNLQRLRVLGHSSGIQGCVDPVRCIINVGFVASHIIDSVHVGTHILVLQMPSVAPHTSIMLPLVWRQLSFVVGVVEQQCNAVGAQRWMY